jgi:hypothetical protein
MSDASCTTMNNKVEVRAEVEVEEDDTSLDHLPIDEAFAIIAGKSQEEIAKVVKRLNNMLNQYKKLKEIQEEKEKEQEDMKIDIWNAHVRNEIVAFEIKDGKVFVGKPMFSRSVNYTSVEKIKQLFHFDLRLANGVPYGYHIGGEKEVIYIPNIKHIFLMTPNELEDSNKFHNCAPEFIKRILPGVECWF